MFKVFLRNFRDFFRVHGLNSCETNQYSSTTDSQTQRPYPQRTEVWCGVLCSLRRPWTHILMKHIKKLKMSFEEHCKSENWSVLLETEHSLQGSYVPWKFWKKVPIFTTWKVCELDWNLEKVCEFQNLLDLKKKSTTIRVPRSHTNVHFYIYIFQIHVQKFGTVCEMHICFIYFHVYFVSLAIIFF